MSEIMASGAKREKATHQIKVTINDEDNAMFEALKKKWHLSTDAETVRQLIYRQHRIEFGDHESLP